MDFKDSVDCKMEKYSIAINDGSNKYDYAKYGVLTRCLPKILFKGNNILASFLQLIDIRIIMMLHYIDRLKHFKHISMYR